MQVNTKAVAERRVLRLESIADIETDLEALTRAERAGTLRHLGNWPAGSIFEHLGRAVQCSFEGFDGFTFPLWLRIFAPLVKTRMLNAPFPTGFNLSKDSDKKAWKSGVGFDEGLTFYRSQLARVWPDGKASTAMLHRHPSFGKMTPDDWVKYQLRHAELHLGFLKG